MIPASDAIFKDAATNDATKTEPLSKDFFTSKGALTYQLSVGGAGWYIEFDATITEDAFQKAEAAKLISTVYMDYALADSEYGTHINQTAILTAI